MGENRILPGRAVAVCPHCGEALREVMDSRQIGIDVGFAISFFLAIQVPLHIGVLWLQIACLCIAGVLMAAYVAISIRRGRGKQRYERSYESHL